MKTFSLLFLITFSFNAIAQDSEFQNIAQSPSLEIYDLLKDSKGYIWLAHDLGISRYDGRNFVNFSNSQQNALSMTDLCEDAQGRIWCHNFEGQIFYIENFKLNLLSSYHFQDELSFPRIVTCGNELIATSVKGIFICDTRTLTSKYFLLSDSTSSLTVLNNKVLVRGNQNWYIYQKGNGITKAIFNGGDIDTKASLSLQPQGVKDTAFLISNPNGYYYKLLIKNNELIVLDKKKADGFINAITITNDEVWVHTKSLSICERKNISYVNQNITDIIKDDEGNIFFSTLKNGLYIKYAYSPVSILKTPFLDEGDFIRKIISSDKYFLCGTQNGKLLLLSKSFNLLEEFSLSSQKIPIEQLFEINDDIFFAGTSIGLFSINVKTEKIALIDSSVILKDIAIKKDEIFLAATKGVIKLSLNNNHGYKFSLIKAGRSRSINYDDSLSELLGSFNDGVYSLNRNRYEPVFYKGQRIYSTIIRRLNKKLLIGTFNQGVFIKEGDQISNLTIADGLLSNSIRNIKVFNNKIWIIYNGFIQKLDEQFKTIPTPVIPFNGSLIYDLVEEKEEIYVTTNTGVYHISPVLRQNNSTATNIDYFLINGKDTAVNKTKFSYTQNDLQVNVSSPFYYSYNVLRYKYRIYQKSESNWQVLDNNQKAFSLVSLQPGSYNLEVIAIDPIGQSVTRPLKQTFEIIPAWFQTTWFKAFLILFFILLFYFLYKYRLQQILKIQQVRKNISSDLHDEIGSTLSSINIYTGLAKYDENKGIYLETISKSVTEVVDKLDDLVWGINPRYDTTTSIINRLLLYAKPLTEARNISFEIKNELTEKEIKLKAETKHNIYLISKELINNAIKYSKCTQIIVRFFKQQKSLFFSIEDDGVGFDKASVSKERNGLSNISLRVANMKGQINIETENGEGTVVQISIPF